MYKGNKKLSITNIDIVKHHIIPNIFTFEFLINENLYSLKMVKDKEKNNYLPMRLSHGKSGTLFGKCEFCEITVNRMFLKCSSFSNDDIIALADYLVNRPEIRLKLLLV